MAFIHRKATVNKERYKKRLYDLIMLHDDGDISITHNETSDGICKIIKYKSDDSILWQEDITIDEMAGDDEKFAFVALNFNDLVEMEYFSKNILKRNA